MNWSVLAVVLLSYQCCAYYEAQYGQFAALRPTRDVCINMIPPYEGRRPLRNRYQLKLEVEAKWISYKRLSVCAYAPSDRYFAFSGMMVQITKQNLPFGEFEPEDKLELTDCEPGKNNLACLRSSSKMLQAAVNWISPPDFDVYTAKLECLVTIIGLNQKYWTLTMTVDPAPYKYPEYGNFTSDIKYQQVE